MSKLREIIRYFCQNYPNKNELSKARLTKMVYLADWKAAKRFKKQLTNIKWFFNYYGPYVDDVFREANTDPYLDIQIQKTMFGDTKTIIMPKQKIDIFNLTPEEQNILDEVINETKTLYWDQFINLVYSTTPVRMQDKFSSLDLVKYATIKDKS